VLVAAVAASATPAQDCSRAIAGGSSFWPGDGSAIDVIGPNSGTPVGGATYAPGWVGQAFTFDGLDFASHDQLQTGQLVSRASSDVGLMQGLLAFLPIRFGVSFVIRARKR